MCSFAPNEEEDREDKEDKEDQEEEQEAEETITIEKYVESVQDMKRNIACECVEPEV
jgi:hypothetical protein